MKILTLNGSARENGYTARVIDRLSSSAQESGAVVTYYRLDQLNIKNCCGCQHCKKQGGCIIQDDMPKIFEQIRDCDVIVFGTPIYFRQASGQFKLFLDRLYPLYGANKVDLGEKTLILVVSQGYKDPEFYHSYIESLTAICNYFNFHHKETLLCYGTNADNCNIEQILERAFALGKELAQER